MKTWHVVRDGAVIGGAGALALAAWLLAIDAVQGHPFATPAALGAGLFQGARAVEAMPANAGWLIVGYTIFHVVVFSVAGCVLALMARGMEKDPQMFFIAFFAPFAFFEIAYYTFAQLFVTRVLPNLSWSALLAGNVLAVAAIAAVMYARHPLLRQWIASREAPKHLVH